jgi:hypothetical protein
MARGRLEDPLDAVMLGSLFAAANSGGLASLFAKVLPRFERTPSPQALAVLLALGSVMTGETGDAVNACARGLTATGIRPPTWSAELAKPLTGGEFRALADDDDVIELLTGTFHRAARTHGVLVTVDPEDCGAAVEIVMLGADELEAAVEELLDEAALNDVELRAEPLSAEQFRWRVENALAARAVHEDDDPDDVEFSPFGDGSPFGLPDLDDDGLDDEDDADEQQRQAAILLLRTRLATLPTPSKPPAPHDRTCEDEIEEVRIDEEMRAAITARARAEHVPSRVVIREALRAGLGIG